MGQNSGYTTVDGEFDTLEERSFLTIDDFNIEGKTIILRIDINSSVNPETGEILDNTRIKRHADTVKELSEKKAKVVILDKMNENKVFHLQALGAEVFKARSDVGPDSPDHYVNVAKKICNETPNSFMAGQFTNPSNPSAHELSTGPEIYKQLDGNVDAVVCGVGTGGTISGIAKRMKEHNPSIQIIGVDPHGSILGGGDEIYPYHVEGIGYDFFPDVLDNKLINQYVKINDKDSFLMAKRLIKEEGLLVGGSSGGAVWASLQVAKKLNKGNNCVVILPDSIRNYLSKFVDDEWMEKNKFNN